MAEMMQLSASLEDYLEAIFHTVEAKGAARAKDIVHAPGRAQLLGHPGAASRWPRRNWSITRPTTPSP